MSTASLSMWSVYERPSDYPAGFVARRFLIWPGHAEATAESVRGASLEDVRRQLPPGLYRIPRQAGDAPHIVESWL